MVNRHFGNHLGPTLAHFDPKLIHFGGYIGPPQGYIGSPWRPYQPILGPMLPHVWPVFIFRGHMLPTRPENTETLEKSIEKSGFGT